MVVLRREVLQRSRRQQALQDDCTHDVESRLLKATRLKQRRDACRDPAARVELARAAALAFDEYDAVRGHWALLQKQLKRAGAAAAAAAFASSDDACALRCAAAARTQRREAAPAATQQQHAKLRQSYARSVRTRERQRAERRAAAAEVSIDRLRRELQRAVAAADGGSGDDAAAAAALVLRWNEEALSRLAAGRAAAALRLLAKAEAATSEDFADEAFPPRGAEQGGGRDVRLRLRSLTYNNYGCVFSAQRDGERALLCFELALGLEDELGGGNPPSTLVNFGAALQAVAGDDRRRHGALLPLTRAAWQLEAELSESLGATQSADGALVDLYARCMHNLGVVKASLASGDGAASGPHDLAQAHVVASGLLGDAHNTTAALRESLQSAGSARGSQRPRSRQSTLPPTPTPASAAAATGSVPSRTPTPLGKTRPPVAPVPAGGVAARGGAEKEKEGGWQLPDIPMSAEEQAVAAAMQRRRY